MKKLLSVVLAIVMIASSFTIAAFAFDKETVDADLASKNADFNSYIDKRFDANGTGALDADDARAILLASAGLNNGSSLKNSDADGDGKITAIDARAVLRLSARLDSPDKYYSLQQKLDYFNAIVNTVKPSTYRYYAAPVSSVDKVTLNDPQDLVGDFNEQINKWLRRFGEDEIDFGKELSATSTTYESFILNRNRFARDANFPVFDQEFVSALKIGNVSKIEYSENQTYKYAHYTTKGEVDYTESVKGLDKLTVYTKEDNLKVIPDDLSTLNNYGLFNVLSKEDADQLVNNSDFQQSLQEIADMGLEGSRMNVNPSLKNVKYYNSYATVYFFHDTGVPVAIDYNFHYDTTTGFDMDIYMNLAGTDSLVGQILTILDIKGSMDVIQTCTEKDSYYFVDNNPAHVDANA